MKRAPKESFEDFKIRRKKAKIIMKKKLKGTLTYNASLIDRSGKQRPYRKTTS